MKHFKTLFLVLAVVTLLSVPCAADDLVLNADFSQPTGGDTGGNGNCLNSYNNCLIGCNGSTQGNTNAGCKVDCWFSYYSCLYNSATG